MDRALAQYSGTALEFLRERAHAAAEQYPAYASQRPGETGSVPCPFPLGTECGIYPARPATCRGWNSHDAKACESAYRRGPDRVVAPVNQRLRMVHASVGDALARAFRDDGRQGHVYLAAVRYELIENERLEAFTRQWLEGAIEL